MQCNQSRPESNPQRGAILLEVLGQCNQSRPESNPQHIFIKTLADYSVTNPGLKAIRNIGSMIFSLILSVTNPGLKAIRNSSQLNSKIRHSVTNPGLKAIRNTQPARTHYVRSVTNPGLKAIRNLLLPGPKRFLECNQSRPESNPQRGFQRMYGD